MFAPISGESRFNIRRLPVSLSVRTGSASAINCSMFLSGSGGGAGTVGEICVVVLSLVGGRRMTPCMAGRVRVPVSAVPIFTCGFWAGVACGVAVAGTGFRVGGWTLAGSVGDVTGFGLSAADLTGGGTSDSGFGFLALKKMSGQGMMRRAGGQFQEG